LALYIDDWSFPVFFLRIALLFEQTTLGTDLSCANFQPLKTSNYDDWQTRLLWVTIQECTFLESIRNPFVRKIKKLRFGDRWAD
jgi:hypothetical protein